jgi:SAM-dependent methyltransferase
MRNEEDMADSAPQIFGTAAHIGPLFGANGDHSLYGPESARLYHMLTQHDTVAIAELLELAQGVEGTILELACGTGRLTVPMAEQGHDMLALDLSPDMVAVLDGWLKEASAESYASRITTGVADMTDFSLGRTFNLIVLGGSAIWNAQVPQRASLFRCVREHLAPEGRFVLTLIDLPEVEADSAPAEHIVVFPGRDGDAPLLVTIFDYIDPGKGVRSTSVLCHRLQDNQVTSTIMGSGLTYPVPRAVLEQEIESAGLRVVGSRQLGANVPLLSQSSNPARAMMRPLLLEISH